MRRIIEKMEFHLYGQKEGKLMTRYESLYYRHRYRAAKEQDTTKIREYFKMLDGTLSEL